MPRQAPNDHTGIVAAVLGPVAYNPLLDKPLSGATVEVFHEDPMILEATLSWSPLGAEGRVASLEFYPSTDYLPPSTEPENPLAA